MNLFVIFVLSPILSNFCFCSILSFFSDFYRFKI